jgi:hypothetical protein
MKQLGRISAKKCLAQLRESYVDVLACLLTVVFAGGIDKCSVGTI